PPPRPIRQRGSRVGPRSSRRGRRPRVLAGPFACALAGSAHSADGDSRCARETVVPGADAGLALSQPGWKDLELLTVLRDSSSREPDSMFFSELFDDLLVGVRARVILRFDDVLDDVFHTE